MEENKKKKKNHYFEIFISKVLKQISKDSYLTINTKQQINSFLCILCKYISQVAIDLTIYIKKKTISEKEISGSISMLITGELLENSITEGNKAVNNYKNSDEKGSKKNKSGIIFPPSIVEKFLRNFGYSKIMVTDTAPIYLAAVLEYLTYEILDLSSEYCKENKRKRITVRDLEIIVKSDNELNMLLKKINISFLGGGVVPYIHPSLLNKKKKTSKINLNKNKFRNGTIALKNIKKYQKTDNLIFPKSSFEKCARSIFKEYKNEKFKISKYAFIILQHFIEQYIVNLLYKTNFLAIHSSRIKVTSTDIIFMSYLINNSKNPYNLPNDENTDVLSIDYQEQLDNYIDDEIISDDSLSNNT